MNRAAGYTLLELLVAMALLGVVLLLAGSLFASSNAYTTLTITSAELEEDARLGLLRITEVTTQAAYIYPTGKTLTLKTGSVTTGKDTLALLVPAESPYCPSVTLVNAARYCLFVYHAQPRSAYAGVLPRIKNPTADVLVERRVQWVDWPVNTLPITDFTALTPVSGVVADSIDTAVTDFSVLEVSRQGGVMDSILQTSVPVTAATALIQVARPLLAVQVDRVKVQRAGYIFVRSIPRATPPGTGASTR